MNEAPGNAVQIDVVTIARGCPQALAATLDSLAEQTGPGPGVLRSVVVVSPLRDDDPTFAVAADPQRRLARRVLRQQGRGIAAAFNQGLAGCRRTAWVLFLNAGDGLADPGVLGRVLEAIAEAGRPPWLTGGIVRVTAGGVDLPQAARQVTASAFQSGNPLCHQATFYRRDLFALVGPYRPSLPQGMDYDLNIRCFQAFGPPALLPFAISRYDLTGVSSIRITQWARFLYRVQRLNRLVPARPFLRWCWELRIMLRMVRRILYIPFKLLRW